MNIRRTQPSTVAIADADPKQLEAMLEALAAFLRNNRADRQVQIVEYLVEQERKGLGHRLKAYSLAVDVFGRSADFDPANQSLVRVEMHRLRNALEQFAISTGGQFPYELEIPLGKYRPRLVQATRRAADDQARPASPNDANDANDGLKPSTAWRSTATYMMLGLVVTAISTLSFFTLWPLADACAITRPTVTLSQTSKVDGILSWVGNFLDYYPLVTKQNGGSETCPGTPHYQVQLSMEKGPRNVVHVGVVQSSTDNIVFENSYPVNGEAGVDPALLVAARIAYDIAHDKGVIPTDALSQPWQNPAAEQDFRCLMKGHGYFYAESTTLYAEALPCLEKLSIAGTTDPEILSIYAALLAQSYLGFVKADTVASRETIDDILARAAYSEPHNKELIMVRLRLARFAGKSNRLEIAQLTDLIGKLYPYEPHLLNQAAIASSANLGRFEQGIRMQEQALAITGPRPLLFWGKLWGEVGMDRWDRIEAYLPYIEDSEFYLDQLLTMIVRRHLQQDELAHQAARRLAKAGFPDRDTLKEKIRTLNYDETIVANLLREVDDFPDIAPDLR